ncbi:DUF3367 domain-containing protein [Nocardioides sp. GCM10028917]|uniref:DUF3367 domain-containing protein n=1 Tax=Nocardioides sp. GCM10028917 TaxID=3273408 RepID=UPI003622483E
MGEGGTPPEAPARPEGDGRRLALRLVATCAALVGLAFAQSPGAQTADTKLDLVVDPGGMLVKALSMWDPIGAFGQVGNQAYGYLWPMGPFFWVGHLLDMPGWVVQRLWLALVLVAAFVGCARLLRALGVKDDFAVILGGLAYALSPRMLTTVGPISIEAWPSAMAPWVLLALVLGSRQGSARRHALAAGLGVAMVGGVNAAATFAVIPLGVVWLLTREPGPRRRALMVWWPVFTLTGCLWWLIPLFVLGAYSPPFLDYIETAALTTYPTTLFDALRGTSAWVPYLEPRWRAGADLITTPLLIQHSTVVLVLGFVGLARRDNPHRVFAVAGLLVGLLMVTFGHTGGFPGWFAAEQKEWLDGVLAPLRNVHKFDPVIRVPLVLGLAHLVDRLISAWRDARASVDESVSRRLSFRIRHLAVVGLAVIAVAGAAQPAWTGRLAPGDSFREVPDYWSDAAAWVAERDPEARTLLLPGSDFGAYIWGTTQDEPIQPLARAPWAVRNTIPLAPVANIRALDALEERFHQGRGSAGLTDYLRRLGVRFLLVRNDLERSSDVVDPVLVHQALASTPGVELVEAFGPVVGGEPKIEREGVEVAINQGWQDSYAAIEVFEVSGMTSPAVSTTGTTRVIGDPESLLDLSEDGVIADEPTVLGYDVSEDDQSSGPLVLTDGMRLRERYFANMHDGTSATLTTREADAIEGRRDYEVTADAQWFTRAEYEGVADLVASSSEADADTIGGARTGRLPYAAVDGDPHTAWVSRSDIGEAPYLRLDLEDQLSTGSIRLTLGEVPGTLSDVRVRTEAGVGEAVVMGAGDTATIPLPAGPTSWIQVEDAELRKGRQLSIAELEVPGLSVTRWLRPPSVPADWGVPDVISLSAHADLSTGCVQLDQSIRCRPQVLDEGEEASGLHRILDLPSPGVYEPRIMVAPRAGDAVPELLQDGQLVTVEASSRANSGASVSSAVAAVDGNPGTTWISSWTDAAPSLNLRWLRMRTVRSIDLLLDPDAPARRVERITVTYPGGSQSVRVSNDGVATLEPFRTASLSILVDQATEGGNLDSDGPGSPLGVGISELRFNGSAFATISVGTAEVDYGCGSGPDLTVDGDTIRTAVGAAPLDLHLGRAVAARLCGTDELSLAGGSTRIELGATPAFRPVSLVLTREGGASEPAPPRTVEVADDTYTLASGDLLVLRRNVNRGWTARSGNDDAAPVTIDGWQQGFRLPSGSRSTDVSFAPDGVYRGGLALGGALLLGSVLLHLFWSRRRPDRTSDRPVGPGRLAGAVTATGVVLAGGLVADWAGFALVGVSLLALLFLASHSVDLAVLAGTTPLAVVGIWNSFHPWGGTADWGGSYAFTQLLLVVPLALLGSALVAPRGLRRDSGRSTSR